MQIGDDIRLGPVYGPAVLNPDEPSPQERGVGPMGRIFFYDIVPAVLGAALLAALQTTAGAANLVLTAGAGVTTRVDGAGVTRYVLDCARNVTLTSAADISAVTFTITGYDIYGQRMTQVRAGPNANTVGTLKAFKEIVSVAVSGAVGTNTSVGIGDVFGLPYRVLNGSYVASVKWDTALAQDAGTLVGAVVTNPSTAALGDVRGTYDPSSASDGTRRLVMGIYLPALASGPNATRLGALGVDQV
jgi:hypothetical protein